jgi:DNA-binding NtrC family response regulator
MVRILVVDDDDNSSRTLKLYFDSQGYSVETTSNAADAFDAVNRDLPDVVISDISMPDEDGLSLLQRIRAVHPDVPVIMITAFQDMESTVAAMKGGAADYIHKPIDIEELDHAVEQALANVRHHDSDSLILDSSDATGTIVGRSRIMKEVFKAIGLVSQSQVTVLIMGESGTGKELVARAIHKASDDAGKPFVAVNCAALVETLLESEMFGHEKGAFTGAINLHKGKVELAGEGTLFLDEIGDLSPRLQSKLLRLLEEREYTPVGGSKTKISNARFVTATNADLEDKVSNGEFREDLYYRLNVFSIRLPALRDRREDIPILVEHLLKKMKTEVGREIRQVPNEVLETLSSHDWPGNIRQLENVLLKSAVSAQGNTLTMGYLPQEILDATNAGNMECTSVSPTHPKSPTGSDAKSLKVMEREHIIQVLDSTGWHKGKTCEILGISRPKLERRIVEYGLLNGQ